jgi:hypothetical protein
MGTKISQTMIEADFRGREPELLELLGIRVQGPPSLTVHEEAYSSPSNSNTYVGHFKGWTLVSSWELDWLVFPEHKNGVLKQGVLSVLGASRVFSYQLHSTCSCWAFAYYEDCHLVRCAAGSEDYTRAKIEWGKPLDFEGALEGYDYESGILRFRESLVPGIMDDAIDFRLEMLEFRPAPKLGLLARWFGRILGS